ncbi:GNAT family N-acetyltransferase [Undibacterium arcticum]|uniref:GNAT family N-acetyltransferase n=1 Tax=Undibacterium arcticum TaxID=1762892 RepID=A0ABV7F0J8_9BURK
MSDPSSFPTLHTANFLLRQIAQDDLADIFRGLSDPRVTAYYGVSYATQEAAQMQMQWYRAIEQQHSGIWWAICRPDAPAALLGTCGFYDCDRENRNVDMGYWLLPEHWGTGVMRESLPAILSHAFSQMRLHRVECEVEPANLASGRLLRGLGFVHEGRRRQVAFKNGSFVDMEYYALLEHELR